MHAIETHGLRKTYPGGVEAVKGIDLEVSDGEVFGLLGPNGAGKSTTVGMLTTTIAPTAGIARLAGYDVAREPLKARGVSSVVFQEPVVDGPLSGRAHLDLHARLWNVPPTQAGRRIGELVQALGLSKLIARPVGSYSGGERRRLEIARALVSSPRLLFLDEPTVGLDVESRRALWEEIRRLVDRGKTVLLTTHYLEEADALADRIAVINQGEIIAEGTPSEIKSQTSGKRIRCITSLSLASVLQLPGVTDARQDREAIEIHAREAESVVRALLARDASLCGLEITSAGLEEAFLALTQDSGQNEKKN
jgi:ABC-2 type transport system ATP-binding protein